MIEVKLYKNFPLNENSNQVYYGKSATALARRDRDFDSYADKDFKNLATCNMTEQVIRLKMDFYVGNQYNYGVIIKDGFRYYFFVDGVEWVANEKVVKLHYHYDWWQTYCHRVSVLDSFVEREHVEDDTFGKHIIEENLPISDYKVQSSTTLDGGATDLLYCICSCDWEGVVSASHNTNTPIPSMCKPSKFESSPQIVFNTDKSEMDILMKKIVGSNKIDSVVGFYAIPSSAIPSGMRKEAYDVYTGEVVGYYCDDSDNLAGLFFGNIVRPNTIDGYTPVNNKCFTYPYCLANVTNNNGNSLIGKFEFSDYNSNHDIRFNYRFPVIEGGVGFGAFRDYDGISGLNFDYSIQGQSSVELPYITNTFSCYMSANHNAIANQYKQIERNKEFSQLSSYTSGVSGIISNATALNLGGMVSSAYGSSMGMIGAELSAQNTKDSIDASLNDIKSKGDVPHGSFIASSPQILGEFGYKAQLLTVTEENIKMIDDYFSMFGYKVNQIKVPNLTGRRYWNYVKTAGVNVVGSVPLEALNGIKTMLDSGVTVWHDITKMYQYGTYKRQNTQV